jgi:outer membrane receptor protein involved in Fe transport
MLEQDLRVAEVALNLEGIVVTADPAGRARGELATASVLGEEAIRQQTAVSLAGVLELVPGMQLAPPGLESVSQTSLRTVPTSGAAAVTAGVSSADLASFGTLIVLDGVPITNNANLQSLGPAGELSFATSAGGGIDLRQIPASAIERVEVIRGVPSARYGDLTQGAIVVDTRTAAIPPELLVRYDARSLEASAVTGRSFGSGEHEGSLTFDLARSRTEPGVSDDQSLRLATQLSHRLRSRAQHGLTLDTRVEAFQLTDDRPENANIRPDQSSWSRDRGLRVSERAGVTLPFDARLTWTLSYSRLEQRSWAASPRVRGPQPFTDRLTPGRSEGWFVEGRYNSELTVNGAPQLLYSRLELDAVRTRWGVDHRLRGGLELRREWNSGAGYQFDMEFPPQVSFNSVQGYDRPRAYDSIPPLVQGALYLENWMSRRLFGEVVANLQLGARLDLLQQGPWWLSGARDAVLQPRMNLEIMPSRWLRLRGGWGRTAKAPSLAQLFPAPQYHDVVNVNYYANDPAERLAVLTTEIKDPTNPSLGFARATKREVGVELSAGGATVEVTGFSDRIDGAVGLRQDPEFVLRDRYALTDTILGNGIRPEIIEPPYATDTVPVLVGRPDNIVTLASRGVELTAFLPEFRPLRTRLQVQGAWIRTRQSTTGLYFGPADIFSNFQLFEITERIPYWRGGTEQSERALLTYRLIHHRPELGLVVTAAIQHNVHDASSDPTSVDTLAFEGYLNRRGELVPVPPADRTAPEYGDLRVPRSGLLTQLRATPADWLLSVQVSKTLPLSGRLSFWAYNVLDNRGIYRDVGVQRRVYAPMRFGLEMTVSTRALQQWLSR